MGVIKHILKLDLRPLHEMEPICNTAKVVKNQRLDRPHILAENPLLILHKYSSKLTFQGLKLPLNMFNNNLESYVQTESTLICLPFLQNFY